MIQRMCQDVSCRLYPHSYSSCFGIQQNTNKIQTVYDEIQFYVKTTPLLRENDPAPAAGVCMYVWGGTACASFKIFIPPSSALTVRRLTARLLGCDRRAAKLLAPPWVIRVFSSGVPSV